jgi:D-3-phosphoglycerate dehydrogenase
VKSSLSRFNCSIPLSSLYCLLFHCFRSVFVKMATSARDINIRRDLNVSQNANLSTSPTASFQSAPSSHGGSAFAGRTIPLPNAKHLKPFATEDIKVLLLENVNQTGRDILTGQGYQVEFLKSSLPEDQLIEKIRFVWPNLSCLSLS